MGNSTNVSDIKNESLSKLTYSSIPTKKCLINETSQNLSDRKAKCKLRDAARPQHFLTKFDYSGTANEVFLTGSFNNWTKIKMSLITQNYYVCELVSNF